MRYRQVLLEEAVEALFGVTVTGVSIGPGEEFEDPYGTWAGLGEIEDGGVLLVRPDLYVGARHLAAPASAQEAGEWLGGALETLLEAVK